MSDPQSQRYVHYTKDDDQLWQEKNCLKYCHFALVLYLKENLQSDLEEF